MDVRNDEKKTQKQTKKQTKQKQNNNNNKHNETTTTNKQTNKEKQKPPPPPPPPTTTTKNPGEWLEVDRFLRLIRNAHGRQQLRCPDQWRAVIHRGRAQRHVPGKVYSACTSRGDQLLSAAVGDSLCAVYQLLV